jgi:hypothetical protein
MFEGEFTIRPLLFKLSKINLPRLTAPIDINKDAILFSLGRKFLLRRTKLISLVDYVKMCDFRFFMNLMKYEKFSQDG